jgi:hypothetical protein
MGVPRGEYEPPGTYGYGTQYRDGGHAKGMAPGLWEQTGNMLPYLKA